MRDVAMGGVAALLNRAVWAASDAEPGLADIVRAGLVDPEAVVRLRAAEAVIALDRNASPGERALAIGERLAGEGNPYVRRYFLHALGRLVHEDPAAVDQVLKEVVGDLGDSVSYDGDEEFRAGVIDVLAFLALDKHTPFATAALTRWAEDASSQSEAICALARSLRDYCGPGNHVARMDAFALLSNAARACRTFVEAETTSEAIDTEEPTPARGAFLVANEIASQIYFASGAFRSDEDNPTEPLLSDPAGFAELAFPLLRECASLQHPQIIHDVVRTSVHLADQDEARALVTIADVATDLYASDILAGADVMPYVRRLLAEQRQLVLSDPAGSEAFRRLLSTFVTAGNEDALEMAYTFAEIFR